MLIKIEFVFKDEIEDQKTVYLYEDGIMGYAKELAGEKAFTDVVYVEQETRGQDSPDRPEYKLKFQVAFAFCNETN